MVVGKALTAVYSAGRLAEGYRYWRDYARNTGYTPRYPLRAMSRDITPVFYLSKSFKKGKTRRRRR